MPPESRPWLSMNAGTRSAVPSDDEGPTPIRRCRLGSPGALTPNGVTLRPVRSRNAFTRELNSSLQRCRDRRSIRLDAHNGEDVFSRASTARKSAKWPWCTMMGHGGSAGSDGSANGVAKHPRPGVSKRRCEARPHGRVPWSRTRSEWPQRRTEEVGPRTGSAVQRGQGHTAAGGPFAPESRYRTASPYIEWIDCFAMEGTDAMNSLSERVTDHRESGQIRADDFPSPGIGSRLVGSWCNQVFVTLGAAMSRSMNPEPGQ